VGLGEWLRSSACLHELKLLSFHTTGWEWRLKSGPDCLSLLLAPVLNSQQLFQTSSVLLKPKCLGPALLKTLGPLLHLSAPQKLLFPSFLLLHANLFISRHDHQLFLPLSTISLSVGFFLSTNEYTYFFPS
jgi:hypothetical protein